MSKLFAVIAAVFMLAVFAVSVAAIRVAQLELRVQPLPFDNPEFTCYVKLRFNNRETECLGRETTSYGLSREEGIFGCIQAYDKFRAAYAFAIMGCIISALTAIVVLLTIFVHKIPHVVPRLMALCAFLAFTIAWPLSWAQTTSPHCGRLLKDATFDNGARISNVARGHGLNCLVAAWALSLGGMALVYYSQSHKKISNIVNTVFGIEKKGAGEEAELKEKESAPTVA